MQDLCVQLETALGLGLHRLQVGVQPIAQHSELQRVEDSVHRLAVPALPLGIRRPDWQVEVVDQFVQFVVADHVGQTGAQAVAGLALDQVDVGDDAVDRSVRLNPLGGRLRAHARNAGEVVTGFAHQRGQVAVAVRPDTVPLRHRRWVHPCQVGNALARVKHRHVVAYQLERIPVAGADQHVEADRASLMRQRRDGVVGLVAGRLHHRNPQRGQDLFGQRDLAGEVSWAG
jgi:hypothetical protein